MFSQPITFTSLDNEFAASTGTNVNKYSGSSRFDYPPSSSHNLTVTSHVGEASPYTFDIGSHYDLHYTGGAGGQVTLMNAKVIRSDSAPGGGGGIVVFEGADSNGKLTQVIWTPGFDLDQWYWDHYNPNAPPVFYTTDQKPGIYAYVCFEAAVPILTPAGPVPAGDLASGDLVVTADGALPLLWVGLRRVQLRPRADAHRPVEIPPGALAPGVPAEHLALSPQHRVLMRKDGTARLVPAKALLGWNGIAQDPARTEVTYVSLLCPRHTVLSAAGTPCESFYPGPEAMKLLDPRERAAIEVLAPGVTLDPLVYGPLRHPVLPVGRARRLLPGARLAGAAFAFPAPARLPA